MYDAIVIGVGSMGSSTCYYLARQGYKVLGLEQFSIPNEMASHSGQSRLIRKAYFEHSDYVPLLKRAYENWEHIQQQTGEKIFYETGLLYCGSPHHPIIKGVKASAAQHKIQLQVFNAANAKAIYPQFNFVKNDEVILEKNAGFLLPAKAISIYVDEAQKYGADIRAHQEVISWEKEKNSIKVKTASGDFETRKLILTAGAWTSKLIPQLQNELSVTRQTLFWAQSINAKDFGPAVFPCWMIAPVRSKGVYYGFPYLETTIFGEPTGLKFAYHHPGEKTDPDKVNKIITENEMDEILRSISKYLPIEAITATKTCLYTNTRDENFIIDHLPGYDKDVTIACGFSGHGFKFVSVVGEILAELAMNGKTTFPINFLNLNRFK
jgi:sarcosine oxidase